MAFHLTEAEVQNGFEAIEHHGYGALLLSRRSGVAEEVARFLQTSRMHRRASESALARASSNQLNGEGVNGLLISI
jgi:hypothetical protein